MNSDINGVHMYKIKYNCRTFKGTRTRAAVVFILGFWMLDLANNTVQVSLLKELKCTCYITFLVMQSNDGKLNPLFLWILIYRGQLEHF